MTLYFITGNKHKFADIKNHIPSLEQLHIDLPEIQDLDPQKVIGAKLRAALDHHDGEFIVEDTSVHFDCMNGLPGTLIKWFLETLGPAGLFNLCDKHGNYKATVRIIIGYASSKENIHFFEGVVHGDIVSVRGGGGFGWDPIFSPEGSDKSFAELKEEGDFSFLCRDIAVEKLKKYLEKK